MRFVHACIGHKEGKVVYRVHTSCLFLPLLAHKRSSWQNQNLCSSIDTPFVVGLITNITWSKTTTIYLFWNDIGFVVMFSVFVWHRAMTIWLWGTMFNLLYVIPKESLKDFLTIVGDNKMKVIGLLHIHSSRLFGWSHCIGHFQMKEVHLIMLVWIYFWFWWKVYLAFWWSKYFTFQVRFSSEKTRTWSVKWKHIKVVKLEWIRFPFQSPFLM